MESELAQANLQKAEALAALGREDDAVEAFRACLRAERQAPEFAIGGWLEFAWFVACRQKRELFDEALKVLTEFEASSSAIGLTFHTSRFKYAGALALMAAAYGERAREFARNALASAAATDSGLSHHPTFGIVGPVDATIRARLEVIAAS